MTEMTRKNIGERTEDLLLQDLQHLLHKLMCQEKTQINTGDLETLHNRLVALRDAALPSAQWLPFLETLFSFSVSFVRSFRPTLTHATLPLHRKIRKKIRLQQKILLLLADEGMRRLAEVDANAPLLQAKLLHHCLQALSEHYLLGCLAASPAAVGFWQKLHRIYNVADRLGLVSVVPQGEKKNIHDLYCLINLFACAQPASFTAQEIDFMSGCLGQWAGLIRMSEKKLSETSIFWIDPSGDFPAVASTRRAVPPATAARFFSCEPLVKEIREQLALLQSGALAATMDLPEFAATVVGQEVIRALISHWGDPEKRRFPRRRLSAHTALSFGLENLLKLFKDSQAQMGAASTWVIINESPEGYAVMHISGEVKNLLVGDIAAIKTDQGWQVCIVRWVLSENPEHLELGLQVLAASAVPVLVVPSSEVGEPKWTPALLLSAAKQLSTDKRLVVPAGGFESEKQKLTVVADQVNVVIREVMQNSFDERNARIDIFSISPVEVIADAVTGSLEALDQKES